MLKTKTDTIPVSFMKVISSGLFHKVLMFGLRQSPGVETSQKG